MNSESPRTKIGLFEIEINRIAKMLFIFMLIISFVLITLSGKLYLLFLLILFII
jgi:hypothetical protein